MNQKNIAWLLAMTIFIIPLVSSAEVGMPCEGPDCTFDDIIILINNIVKFLVFSVAVPLAAIGFMFMGAKLVLMQNKEAEMTKAKEGLWNIVIGFGIMLASYVVIKTALFAFLSDEQKTFMGFLFQ